LAELNRIPRIRRLIARARRHMNWPRLAGAFGPLLVFVAIFLFLALTGSFERLPAWVNPAAMIIFVLGGVILAVRAFATYRPSTAEEAKLALDRGSDMRPLVGLEDRPVSARRDAQSLWEVHTQRLMHAARRLKLPSTRAEWNRADPLRLRYGLPLLLIFAFAYAGEKTGSRLLAAIDPDYGALMGAEDLRVDAWVTPPDYTGRAPVFLTPDMTRVEVPEGSELTVRVLARSAPTLEFTNTEGELSVRRTAETPDGAYEAVVRLEETVDFNVDWWGDRAGWGVDVLEDAAPVTAWVEEPTVTPTDKTAFSWTLSDDFGVERLFLEVVKPAEGFFGAESDRIEIVMNAVAPLEAEEDTELDLARHKWAGLELRARIVAVDGAGQEGRSETINFTMPSKLFLQPMARAAQEVRLDILRENEAYEPRDFNTAALDEGALNLEAANRLETAPNDVQLAALKLDGLTHSPEGYFKDLSIFLGLRHARHLLGVASSLQEAQELTEPVLWMVALRAEYGSVADALERLLAAKRALEKALRDGASEDEIRRLTEAFKEAAKDYIAAKMAEALARDGLPGEDMEGMDGELGDMGGPGLGAGDLQSMLNALSDLTETGAADQARQLLSDITSMLENLEFQRGGRGGGQDGFPMPGEEGGEEGEDQPADQQAMNDILERLSELLGEQRELNDDTLSSQQSDPFAPPAPGQSPGDLAERQGELGDLLSELEREAERMMREAEEGGEGPGSEDGEEGTASGAEGEEGEEGGFAGLDEDTVEAIRRAQRRAERALERGDFGAARRFQDEATEELRDLSGAVAEELDRMRGDEAREDYDGDERDPFGNPVGGLDDTDAIEIPEEAERQRAKDILDEIRRRFGEAEDDDERDYLERLLDRF
jgi:uncharacterized protein (TIGR02302 family)